MPRFNRATIDELRMLLALEDQGSVKAAAGRLGIRQPAAVKRLKVFRNHQPLIETNNRNHVDFTARGRAALPAVRALVAQYDRLMDFLAGRHSAPRVLRIATGASARWDDTPDSQALARRRMFEFYAGYAMRARENACFCVLTDQAGRAGTVASYPPEHPNQPHHAGAAIVFDPAGRLICHAGLDRVRDEMIVADLDAERLHRARSQPNYTLRTRRPELFGELVRDQASC